MHAFVAQELLTACLGSAQFRAASTPQIRPYLSSFHFGGSIRTPRAWSLSRGLTCPVFPAQFILYRHCFHPLSRGRSLQLPQRPWVPWLTALDPWVTEGLVIQPSAFLITFSQSRKVPFASCLKTEGPTSPPWAHEGRPTTLWAIKGTQVEPYTREGWISHLKHCSTPGTGFLWETAQTGCLGAQGPHSGLTPRYL